MSQDENLLAQIRSGSDEAWTRFARLTTPVLFRWAEANGVKDEEASQLVGDVLAVLYQKLSEYDAGGSFKSWLHGLSLESWRRLRKDSKLTSADEMFWKDEYPRQLIQNAVRLVRPEFPADTWRACWEQLLKGTPAAEVAAHLGVDVDIVYTARSRVLRRIRSELQGLLD